MQLWDDVKEATKTFLQDLPDNPNPDEIYCWKVPSNNTDLPKPVALRWPPTPEQPECLNKL